MVDPLTGAPVFTDVLALLTDLGVLPVVTLGAIAFIGAILYKRFRG